MSVTVLSTLILVKSVSVADISVLGANKPSLSWKHQRVQSYPTVHHELSDGVVEVNEGERLEGEEVEGAGLLGRVTVEQAVIFVYGLVVRE